MAAGAKEAAARYHNVLTRCNKDVEKASKKLVVSEFEGVSVILCVCSAHSALKRLFQRRDAEDSQRPLRKLAI